MGETDLEAEGLNQRLNPIELLRFRVNDEN